MEMNEIYQHYHQTLEILKETCQFHKDKILNCSKLYVQSEFTIPSLTFIGTIINGEILKSSQIQVQEILINPIQSYVNHSKSILVYILDIKYQFNKNNIYVFHQLEPIICLQTYSLQFVTNNNTIIYEFDSYSQVDNIFHPMEPIQNTRESQEQLKSQFPFKIINDILNPYIIKFKNQNIMRDGISIRMMEEQNNLVIQDYKGLIFCQQMNEKSQQLYLQVADKNGGDSELIDYINLVVYFSNKNEAIKKYKVGNIIMVKKLKYEAAYQLKYFIYDNQRQVSLDQGDYGINQNFTVRQFQQRQRLLQKQMNYSLLDQIEFDTYDRKIRKIKVDIIKCFIYIAKLKCYQCPDGYAKSSVDSIYCVKCNNLLDKGKLKLDQFCFLLVQDIKEQAYAKVLENDKDEIFQQCLKQGDRMVFNQRDLKKLPQKVLICQAYCDIYKTLKTKKMIRNQKKQKIVIQDQDELIGLECEWFQDYENYKEMMVYINGAIEMNNKEVERVKCLDVLNAFNIELGQYSSYLKQFI